ncbi:Serine/threonine-protein phosphatase 2A activator [Heracleum sosnowskyi]|uniref:Serine/threonine-protein phosphatase 2A activator n=1 Tax=Heracleum sosnowskyi TaxID=360622 RepID=A0AAD8IHR3_9APIA|nr:Serine/threonine-protein phosphatase 2A activator [Heracleum sosnowskyi]
MDPPTQSPQTQPPHHHHTSACINCGGPTSFPPPPNISDINSSPPVYVPIRAPAINLPPNPQNTQQAIILTPVPQSQETPILDPPYNFQTPIKKITSQSDIQRFQASPTCKNFLGFVVSLSEAIKGHKLSDPCHESVKSLSLLSILETLERFVHEIPPLPQAARYGNLAYRDWHERMCERAEIFVGELVGDDLKGAVVELVPYFSDSFGNWNRVDYGTGHETNFAAFLFCLARLGVIRKEDYHAVVSRVFVKYLDLMRKLQLVYNLEPAGSHGVWGLDDYHFLPFIFGSSQLIDHKYMKPKSIHNDDIVENFSKEYLYLSCIAFVKKVKKGLFAEHSPLLDDISGVPNWKKVNGGLLKMYKVEVLEKVPIMQHFLFGSIIPWE